MEKSMAKITKYTKDAVGQRMLWISAVVLIIWLAIAGANASYPPTDPQTLAAGQQTAEGGGAVWYYLGIIVVSLLWGMGNYERSPGAYKSRRQAAVVNLLPGCGLGFIVWLLLFASRNPELLSDLLLGQ